MEILVTSILAASIGYAAGRSGHWQPWHGPAAAIIALPIALVLGYPLATTGFGLALLSAGFLAAMRDSL